MRAGASHKTGVERALLTVRARIQTAIDALDGKDPKVEHARLQLDQAEQALRNVELKVSSAKSRPSALLEDNSLQTSADTRDWLLKTFTDHDIDVAQSNFMVQTSSPSRFGEQDMAKRRSSVQESISEITSVTATPEVKSILSKASKLDFDAVALEATPQAGKILNRVFGSHIIHQKGNLIKDLFDNGWIEDSSAFHGAYLLFLGRLDSLYATGAQYHGAAHAIDVTAATSWLMQSAYVRERTTALDVFMSLAAASMHDVGHPGFNNLFQTKTMSPLAIRYNDLAILENMHVALGFETMQSDRDCDWFSLVLRDASCEGTASYNTTNLQQYVRKGIISMVLATDMARHSAQVSALNTLAQEQEQTSNADADFTPEESEKAAKQKALERKLFLLETVLHGADISNAAKPRPIMLGWVRRVLTEFWSQGDEEKRLGLEVSPLCDRNTGMVSVPKGQIGFISFVVQPFFKPLASLIKEVQEAKDELESNLAFWKLQDADGSTFEHIFSVAAPA